MKSYIFFFFTITTLLAKDILVSTEDIQFKSKLQYHNLQIISSKQKIYCTPFKKDLLLKQSYRAKRYIPKNRPICNKDVEKIIDHKVTFDFGAIEIIKDGQFIGETDKYIKIKKNDGKIEKIFKDGNL